MKCEWTSQPKLIMHMSTPTRRFMYLSNTDLTWGDNNVGMGKSRPKAGGGTDVRTLEEYSGMLVVSWRQYVMILWMQPTPPTLPLIFESLCALLCVDKSNHRLFLNIKWFIYKHFMVCLQTLCFFLYIYFVCGLFTNIWWFVYKH